MTSWLLAIGSLYALLLVWATWHARRTTRTADDYMLAGSNLGAIIGMLTISATQFSTFTLMGMPDFFRTHGVGAWIFLGVSDAAMAFVILWYGYHLRRKAARLGFKGVAGLLCDSYGSRWVGYLYFAGVFLFLTPYVSIQIRGIGIFLNAAYPDTLPIWGWALSIVLTLLVYSELGGLKAIIFSDALQGLVMLVATWIIAIGCVAYFGGIPELFARVAATKPALLSTPGPHGLFSLQFLLASFVGLMMMPITQPQLAMRMVIMKDFDASRRMAIGFGIFSMLVILPAIATGLYGAMVHPDASTPQFLARVLLLEQTPIVAATVAVGLMAAAMSTADSQLFALGAELRSLLRGEERRVMLYTRSAIGLFALAAFGLAIVSSDQLVLVARVSFIGTAILGPLVLLGVFAERPNGAVILPLTALALIVFLFSLGGFVPSQIGGFRFDLVLFGVLGIGTVCAARWPGTA